MYSTNLAASVDARAKQAILFVRELRRIAADIVVNGNAGTLTAPMLVVLQNQLVQVKANFTSWPYGSLTDATVRAKIAEQYPGNFADAAAVQTENVAVNQRFNTLQAAIESTLAAARANGQFYDADPVTGAETPMLLASPATDAVVAAAASVRDSIGAP